MSRLLFVIACVAFVLGGVVGILTGQYVRGTAGVLIGVANALLLVA